MRSALVDFTSPFVEELCGLVPNFSIGVNVGVATTDVEVPVRALCVGALNWGITRLFRSLVNMLKHFIEEFTKSSAGIKALIAKSPMAAQFIAVLPKLLFQSVGDTLTEIGDGKFNLFPPNTANDMCSHFSSFSSLLLFCH